MSYALASAAAFALDWLFGEPRRWHPLVGFGSLAQWMEKQSYGGAEVRSNQRIIRGTMALILIILPIVWFTALLSTLPYVGIVFSTYILYFSIGHKSLHDHARPIAQALRENKHEEARERAAQIVSRDSAALDIPAAATESVLENGNDGVFGALFWFFVAGAPGAIVYRLANTLDAMWGYRTPRYLHFGWAAARFDDLLNYLPARLTAFSYALVSMRPHYLFSNQRDRFIHSTKLALRCWWRQAPHWDSPNAGPVMASGAGALGVEMGGPARYQGEWHTRPVLGAGNKANRADIERALRLVRHSVFLWLGIYFAIQFYL